MKNNNKTANRFVLALLLALGLVVNLSVSVFAYDEITPAQYHTDSLEIEFIPIPDDEVEAVRKAGELNRNAALSSLLPQRTESLYNTSNLYYYNQMNSSEKELYNKIVKSCESLLNSYADVTVYNGKYYYADYIQLSSPMPSDTVHKVIFAVYYSNPQYFFLNNSYTGHVNSSGSMISVAPMIRSEFVKGTVRMEANTKIQTITNDWMRQINALRSDLAKEKWIAQKLCETITYQASNYDQTIAGALIDQKCVCNGYAMAMTYFCNAAGLSCTLVTSHNHAWNVISLGGVWYEVDATWMDQTDYSYAYIDSRWLNKSRSTFESNDESGSHKLDSKHTGILKIPNCTKDYPSCTAHTWGDSIVTKNPTASSYGYKFHFCSVCSDSEIVYICPNNLHSWGNYLSGGGYHWRVCSVCQSMSDKSKHSFEDGICSVCNIAKPFGDLNDDGMLNNADIILLGRAYMSKETEKNFEKYAIADMNGDKKITNADIILLGRLYMNQKA